MASERLQKILARAGHGSRRSAEKLIRAGRIRVNGKVAELGMKADANTDVITIDHQRVGKVADLVYIAVNKAAGVISTTGEKEKRKKISDIIPNSHNLHLVGRLDKESEGLILLTNDGELTNRLTHPRYGHEKEYLVLVTRAPDKKQLDSWQRGLVLSDGYKTRPVKIRLEKPSESGAWLRIVMKEGRKRQIRESAEIIGLRVAKLIRVRIATLKLGDLKSGAWRHLEKSEIQALMASRKIA